MRRLDLLDTSVVVELLLVPFESDRHEQTRVAFDERKTQGVELQMPVAALVEAGGHVGRIDNGHHRRECAIRLSRFIENTVDRSAPWSFMPMEWDEELLRELLVPEGESVPALIESLALKQLEMGDLLIVAEYERVRANLDPAVVDIDVWTYDAQLRAVVDALRAE